MCKADILQAALSVNKLWFAWGFLIKIKQSEPDMEKGEDRVGLDECFTPV